MQPLDGITEELGVLFLENTGRPFGELPASVLGSSAINGLSLAGTVALEYPWSSFA